MFFCSILGYHNRQRFGVYEVPSVVVENAARDDVAAMNIVLVAFAVIAETDYSRAFCLALQANAAEGYERLSPRPPC